MSKWQPDIAPIEVEKEMEAKDLSEEDRDEVRRFAEFLRRRKGRHMTPIEWAEKGWRECGHTERMRGSCFSCLEQVISKAVAAEREACAKTVEGFASEHAGAISYWGEALAARIRAGRIDS